MQFEPDMVAGILRSTYRWKVQVCLVSAVLGVTLLAIGSVLVLHGPPEAVPDIAPDSLFVAGFAGFAGAAAEVARARRAAREFIPAVGIATGSDEARSG
jgi:hypothetical protein